MNKFIFEGVFYRKLTTCIFASILAGTSGLVFAQQQASTLDKIKATGTVVMGVRENVLPFSTIGANGVASGYSVDICNRVIKSIEKSIGKPVAIKYVGVNAQNRIEFLKNNTIDMECGTTTHTTAREKEVDFSYPFFISGIRIAVRKNSVFTDFNNLKDAKVAVTKGSTAEKLILNLQTSSKASGKGFEVRAVASNDEGVVAVDKGQVDAFATDDVLLAGAIITNQLQDKLVRVGRGLSVEPYAIMLRKGDKDFLAAVDKAITPILTSGEAERLIKSWFDTPTLRYSINHMTQGLFSAPAKNPAFP